jgi:hypothetical protein
LFIIWVCCALECNISFRWIRYHLRIDVLFQCIKSSIGVCEVGGLVTLRARQLLDEKWEGQSAIFLLAHNATSSIYWPALASIVLGNKLMFYDRQLPEPARCNLTYQVQIAKIKWRNRDFYSICLYKIQQRRTISDRYGIDTYLLTLTGSWARIYCNKMLAISVQLQ